MTMDENSPETKVLTDEKKKEDSPALTEATSYTSSRESSPDADFKNSSIRRNLFKINTDGHSPTVVGAHAEGSPSTRSVLKPTASENFLLDTTSTTSSETTAKPSWNLSTKDATEKNVEVPLNRFILSRPVPLLTTPPTFPIDQTEPILYSPSPSASDRSHLSDDSKPQLSMDEEVGESPKQLGAQETNSIQTEDEKKPSVIVEDPPEEPTSCNAALNLTPVQLAEMFLALSQSARQRYQGSEETGKAAADSNTKTPSPSKAFESTTNDSLTGSPPPSMISRYLNGSSSPNDMNYRALVRSIERERNALKITAKQDAQIISNLHHAVDAQKQLNSLKEIEIMDKQAELRVSEQRILTLQKEHEDFLDRETEFVETINILKKELDKITLLKTVPSDELEYLKSDLELSRNNPGNNTFNGEMTLEDSRAKQQQVRITELENSLKEKEKENFNLQTKVDWLRNQLEELGKTVQDSEPAATTNSLNVSKNEAEASSSLEVESLLKDIVKRLEAVETDRNEKESYLKTGSNRSIEEAESFQNHRKIESEHNSVSINVTEHPDAIETLSLKKVQKGIESGSQSTWCCDWSIVSGE